MRRCLSAFVMCWALSAQAESPVNDLTLVFDEFYTRTAALPMPERVAEFRRTVGARFPAFYGDERGTRTHAEQDERIAAAIKGYPALRDAYLKKARGFGAQLPGHVASFQQRFPDYRLPGNVWFIHGLGEMDGGTRELAGKAYLIFAADGMARYHGDNDEAAFFHHELFHTYHEPKLAACGESVVWRRLWTEGLATYVSHAMHGEASDKELLLDFPDGTVTRTRANLPAAWAQLEQVLDSEDPATNVSLFEMGGKHTVLPPRRGYYLGYLVAQEAARTHSLADLAALGCEPARALVAATVHRLNADASGTGRKPSAPGTTGK